MSCDAVGDGAPRGAGASADAQAGAAVLLALKRLGRAVGTVLTSPLVAPVYPACVVAAGMYLAAGRLGDSLGVSAAHVHAQTLGRVLGDGAAHVLSDGLMLQIVSSRRRMREGLLERVELALTRATNTVNTEAMLAIAQRLVQWER